MDGIRFFLATHWLAIALFGVGLAPGGGAWQTWRRRGAWPTTLVLLAGSVSLLAVGSLAIPSTRAAWLAGLAFVALFAALLVVVVTGRWSAPLGHALGGLLL